MQNVQKFIFNFHHRHHVSVLFVFCFTIISADVMLPLSLAMSCCPYRYLAQFLHQFLKCPFINS